MKAKQNKIKKNLCKTVVSNLPSPLTISTFVVCIHIQKQLNKIKQKKSTTTIKNKKKKNKKRKATTIHWIYRKKVIGIRLILFYAIQPTVSTNQITVLINQKKKNQKHFLCHFFHLSVTHSDLSK